MPYSLHVKIRASLLKILLNWLYVVSSLANYLPFISSTWMMSLKAELDLNIAMNSLK